MSDASQSQAQPSQELTPANPATTERPTQSPRQTQTEAARETEAASERTLKDEIAELGERFPKIAEYIEWSARALQKWNARD
jgi:hypothetical protein